MLTNWIVPIQNEASHIVQMGTLIRKLQAALNYNRKMAPLQWLFHPDIENLGIYLSYKWMLEFQTCCLFSGSVSDTPPSCHFQEGPASSSYLHLLRSGLLLRHWQPCAALHGQAGASPVLHLAGCYLSVCHLQFTQQTMVLESHSSPQPPRVSASRWPERDTLTQTHIHTYSAPIGALLRDTLVSSLINWDQTLAPTHQIHTHSRTHTQPETC